MTIRFHKGDLPNLDNYPDSAAVDSETLGLNPLRDRLCVVQLSPGDGTADVIQIAKGQKEAPVLKSLLENPDREIIFHFARFDVAVLEHALGISTNNVYCTKIASRLTRTYTDRHGEVKPLLQKSVLPTEYLQESYLMYAIIFAIVGFAVVYVIEKMAPTKQE